MAFRHRLWTIVWVSLICAGIGYVFAAGRLSGNQDITIQAAGYTWHCSVHVPAGYDKSKPVPLVLILHGAGGNGLLYLTKCGWGTKSDEAGFIAAAPDGLPAKPTQPVNFLTNPNLWNDGQLRPISPRARVNDIAFFKALIADLEQRYNIDTSRVYVAGHSNGAGMTFRLGGEMADVFAAIAPVASHCWAANPKPSRPVPTLYIIGNQDTLVPVAGGTSTTPWNTRQLPPVSESLSKWAKAIGDSPTPELVIEKNGMKIMTYPALNNGTDMFAYYVEGQGHNWPGGKPMLPGRVVGPSNSSFSATDAIWDFFSKHRK